MIFGDLNQFAYTLGYFGIFLVMFAETGFLLGFFFPGDSLLFVLGILASTGHFSIGLLFALVVVAVILGDSFGYWCGKKFGEAIFRKEDSFFFRKSYVENTRNFYERYGKKTIILARFVPIVRTFAPIMAGVGKMNYKTFFSYNVIGGVIWPSLMLFSGFYLGSTFPQIEKYLTEIILAIIFVSILPIVFEFFKKK